MALVTALWASGGSVAHRQASKSDGHALETSRHRSRARSFIDNVNDCSPIASDALNIARPRAPISRTVSTSTQLSS